MNILRRKFRLLNQQQSGLSMIEILVGVLVTGLLAFGGTMATVQILQQARSGQVEGENVRGVAQLVRQKSQTEAPTVRPSTLTTPELYKYAIIATGGDIVLGSHSTVVSTTPDAHQADIYAQSEIDLKSNANVDGRGVVASGPTPDPIILRSQAVLYGGEIYNSTLVFETVDTAKMKTEAQNGGTVGAQTLTSGTFYGPKYINGDLSISGTAKVNLAAGPVYVKGKITIDGTARVEGTGSADVVGIIVAEDLIDIKGNAGWQPPDVNLLPLIVTTSNKNNAIQLNSNSNIAGMLYAQNGDVRITGNSSVYGNIIGVNVTAQSGNEKSTITYPTALLTR